MKRELLIFAALVLSLAPPSPAQKARWTIGMSQCNLGEPWRVQMNADIKKAAEGHPEITVVYKDAQNDNLRQVAHIEEFVRAGVNLILISPKEAAPLTRAVADAYDKGIPVIVLDRKVLGDRYTCFIGADNKKIGRAAGSWIAKFLGGKGNVVELKGLMTSIPGQDRNSGFREGIRTTRIQVLFEADMKWLVEQAGYHGAHPDTGFSFTDYLRALPGGESGGTGRRDGVCRHRRASAGRPDVREAGNTLCVF